MTTLTFNKKELEKKIGKIDDKIKNKIDRIDKAGLSEVLNNG